VTEKAAIGRMKMADTVNRVDDALQTAVTDFAVNFLEHHSQAMLGQMKNVLDFNKQLTQEEQNQ
jgi:hypothetical protein